MNTALVCVSAPATKPLIRKAFPGVFAVSNNQSFGRETHGKLSTRKTRKPRVISFGDREEHEFDDIGRGHQEQSLESGQFERGKTKAASDDSSGEQNVLANSIAPVKIRGQN